MVQTSKGLPLYSGATKDNVLCIIKTKLIFHYGVLLTVDGIMLPTLYVLSIYELI